MSPRRAAFRRALLTAFFGASLVLACHTEKPRANVDASIAEEHAIETPVDAKAPRAKSSAKKITSHDPQPETSEERAQHRSYAGAMARGRQATLAKKYDEAIAAFNDARAAKKNDAQAAAELGYARLLDGKDLDAASADLDEAAALSSDPKLLAQVWFNRGLVDEARKDETNASVDFFVSNRLSPTSAAKKKIGDKKVCPVHVDRSHAPSKRGDVVDAADWLALERALPSTSWEDDARPQTSSDALTALTGQSSEPKLPVIAIAGHASAGRQAFVVVRHDGKLRAIKVGEEVGGRCPGEVQFNVTATFGNLVHVSGSETLEGGYSYMCKHKDAGEDDGVGPCGSAEFQGDGEPFQSFCAGGTATERDAIVDIARGAIVLTAERPFVGEHSEDARITALFDGKSLRLSGLDCDRAVSVTGDGGP